MKKNLTLALGVLTAFAASSAMANEISKTLDKSSGVLVAEGEKGCKGCKGGKDKDAKGKKDKKKDKKADKKEEKKDAAPAAGGEEHK